MQLNKMFQTALTRNRLSFLLPSLIKLPLQKHHNSNLPPPLSNHTERPAASNGSEHTVVVAVAARRPFCSDADVAAAASRDISASRRYTVERAQLLKTETLKEERRSQRALSPIEATVIIEEVVDGWIFLLRRRCTVFA